MTALAFALKHWKLILGGLTITILGIMLADARGDAHHWEKRYTAEHEAYVAFQADVRSKTELARQLDAANKARVEKAQDKVSQETVSAYQTQLDALRQRYAAGVRAREATAHSGGSGGSAVSGVPQPAGRSDVAAAEGGFLPAGDALVASEQAIQLQELQNWVRDQQAVDR